MRSRTLSFVPSEKVPLSRIQGETLLNTTMEISVPVFLEVDMQSVRLGSTIGEGGAGSVRVGELLDAELISRSNVRRVAVKLLEFPEKMSKEQQTARLLQEVSILWSCSFHPNVVDFVGFSKDPMVIITKMYSTDLMTYILESQEPIPISLSLKLAGYSFSPFVELTRFDGSHLPFFKIPDIIFPDTSSMPWWQSKT